MQCPYCRVAHIREDAEAKYCATCGLIEWKKEGDDMEEIIDLIARERMERELSQPCLPTMEPEKVKQEVML